jgi:hypothetical protein
MNISKNNSLAGSWGAERRKQLVKDSETLNLFRSTTRESFSLDSYNAEKDKSNNEFAKYVRQLRIIIKLLLKKYDNH